MSRLSSLLLVGACSEGGTLRLVEVASPSDGAVIASPWVPLLVRVEGASEPDDLVVTLDGEPWRDPLALTSARARWFGEGWDWLATLELLPLEPGEHTLELSLARGLRSDEGLTSTFVYDRPDNRVLIRLTDAAGAPQSARVVVLRDEQPWSLAGPDALAADPRGRDVAINSFFVIDGEGEVWLPDGDFRLLVVTDVRGELLSVPLALDGDVDLELELAREVLTPGWLSADLHVHTGHSDDAFIPDRVRYASLLGAGLDLVLITDHETIVDGEGPLREVGGPRHATHAIRGVEASAYVPKVEDPGHWVTSGHFNVFPVMGEDAAPIPARRVDTLAHALDDWLERQEEAPYPGIDRQPILQLNHPRGIQFRPDESPEYGTHALFRHMDFDRSEPLDAPANALFAAAVPETGTSALDFDAIEVLNRFSLPLYAAVRLDWFALLNQGVRMTGTGNSDSHAQAVELAGLPMNLVRCPPPGPGGRPDEACFVDALLSGDVRVTSGPVLSLAVDTREERAGLGELLSAPDGRVTLRVGLEAASWVPVHELRVVVDGRVVRQWRGSELAREADGRLDLRRDLNLVFERDGWVLVEAGWPLSVGPPDDPVEALGDYAFVAPGYVPLGFTNPVFIDADGDGLWTPPGL